MSARTPRKLRKPVPRRPGPLLETVRAVSRGFLALPFPLFRWGRVNLPNQLTLLRMALLPAFIVLFTSDDPRATWAGLALFGLMALTDWLDGYLARKHGLITNFGKIMDPLADKLLMLTAMILLVQEDIVPGWMVVLTWWRELAVTGLRTLVATRRTVLAADSWGKMKTVLQVVAVIAGMLVYALRKTLDAYYHSLRGWQYDISYYGGEYLRIVLDTNAVPFWAMFFATIVSVWSGIRYFRKNWEAVCLELEDAEKVDA